MQAATLGRGRLVAKVIGDAMANPDHESAQSGVSQQLIVEVPQFDRSMHKHACHGKGEAELGLLGRYGRVVDEAGCDHEAHEELTLAHGNLHPRRLDSRSVNRAERSTPFGLGYAEAVRVV